RGIVVFNNSVDRPGLSPERRVHAVLRSGPRFSDAALLPGKWILHRDALAQARHPIVTQAKGDADSPATSAWCRDDHSSHDCGFLLGGDIGHQPAAVDIRRWFADRGSEKG